MTNFLLFLVLILLVIYLPVLHDIYKLLLRMNEYIDFLEGSRKAEKQNSNDIVMSIDGHELTKSDIEKFFRN